MSRIARSFVLGTSEGREVQVREARGEDHEAYIAAIRSVIRERPRTLVVQESELWDRAGFEANLNPWGPRGGRLVVLLQGEICGSLSIHRKTGMLANSHVASFGLFLIAHARGLGIGRGLLQIVDLWAEEHGVTRIEMPVFANNERAQRLYRSMGYQIEGYERRAIVFPDGPVDEIRMAKLL